VQKNGVPLGQRALATGRRIALGKPKVTASRPDPEDTHIDVVDLFSGCGGMSAGFRLFTSVLSSYRLAGALDIDSDANETYRLNLGIQPLESDAHAIVTERSAWKKFQGSLQRKAGNRLVVAGGPPCQGFSSHRKTIAGCDSLNSLLHDFACMATRLDPDAIIFENVPELLTERSWPFYQNATDLLRQHGYLVRTRIYNFADFGVPQERFRSLTVAMRKPFSMPHRILARSEYRTVRQAIGHLSPMITPGMPDARDPIHVTARHRPSTVATMAAVPKNGGRRPLDIGPECLRQLAVRNGRTGYDDVYGRLWWDRPAVTITGHSRNPASGRFVHPEQDRGLSVREAALLQGFPPDYTFAGSFDSQFMQVGNAVPPSFAAYLAGHILSELITERHESPELNGDIVSSVGTSFSRLIAGIKRGFIEL